MNKEKKVMNWCIPVPRELNAQVEKAVALDSHMSKSEFVRDAVRRLLSQHTINTSPQTKSVLSNDS